MEHSEEWLQLVTAGTPMAVPIHDVVEIWGGGRCFAIPGVPPHIIGMCDWAGSPLVIIDLAKALSLGGDQDNGASARTTLGLGDRRVPVLQSGDLVVGAVVDRVLGIVTIPEADKRPPELFAQGPLSRYACGQHDGPRGITALLDVGKLLQATRVQG